MADILEITNPTSVSEWKKGTQYTITWDYGADHIEELSLWQGDTRVEVIDSVFLNENSKLWTPGTELTSGTDYRIYIEDINEESDWSPYFTIYSAFMVQLNDSLDLGDSIAKDPTKVLSDNLSLSDSIIKQITKILSDNLALSDDLLTKVDFTKILSDTY